ncbi:MAG: glycosyltransferase family 2 protein [Chitinophagaceae bacterium]|nr:glycosyltransferase family 2 protein [Chitinophagaceae bacterium]
MSLISIIIPIYDEEENIYPLYEEIKIITPPAFEVIWVDDGSTDDSLKKIAAISASDDRVKCISLSRNFGHQAALLAGLRFAKGESIIIMDGDFQHPPSLIPLFLEKLSAGYDIVSGKRTTTENISYLKKTSSRFYYKLINFLSDTHIEENTADFRAFNRKVLNVILQFDEKEIFLRGIFSWIGFKKNIVNYKSPERKFGYSKYSSAKMFRLGVKGVLSFSFKPLRISLVIGTIISIVAFIFAINAVIAYLSGHTVPGWTSLIIAVMMFGGIQLLFLGLIGEYIASLFTEIKNRPLYIIDQTINISE